ncbi:TetR family transcriptional regulator [Synechococcales cyanobacterium C]|uniref:TetR family transcriptional regulator n=1 Tax=Petrachloros mirabilis ULC683 TaxID=2781853 RepID=A0A8K2A2L9_9CYAN|nr:TetR/AcrR family transcriptional regulator [Petrachloros mirabilis]NCJ08437.1 TetR family transcriptional regulator [Petrachloros mirabilis ULC683]
MTAQRKSTRQRLVQAALQLFAAQGVTETTTRQIAELADVNEVTLFRHFGSKHGLLLAVIEEAEIFTQLGQTLGQQAQQAVSATQALRLYADGHLRALEQIPEFVRSLVGEAGHYPVENREAIGRGLTQIHRYAVQYLTQVALRSPLSGALTPAQLAALLNTLLLGYAVIEFTTEFHELWPGRDAFIADAIALLQPPEPTSSSQSASASDLPSRDTDRVMDLPTPLVRAIFQQARKAGLQDYAMAYVLFGAGLSAQEISQLLTVHSLCDPQQHILQVGHRQVPLNQWILGHRYGSHTKNPLTQWLKSRKDDHPALFLNDGGSSLTETDIHGRWQAMTTDILTPIGQPPRLENAQDTWRVEMLVRGISLEALSLLAGCTPAQLQPYVSRAEAKAALEQALRLDQRPSKMDNG